MAFDLAVNFAIFRKIFVVWKIIATFATPIMCRDRNFYY